MGASADDGYGWFAQVYSARKPIASLGGRIQFSARLNARTAPAGRVDNASPASTRGRKSTFGCP